MSGIMFGCIVPHPPLLVPDVGRGQEHAVKSTADAMQKLAEQLGQSHPEVLAIISPHGAGYSSAMGVFTGQSSTGSMRSWGSRAPESNFNNDHELAATIVEQCEADKIPVQPIGDNGYDLDHGVMVPMRFLSRESQGLPLVPLTFSWLPLKTHFSFGQAIRNAATRANRDLAIIASGDLSHRLSPNAPAGYDTMGKVFDDKLVSAISRLDEDEILNLDPSLIERAGECGLRSIVILLGALHGLAVKPQVLSYEGPFGVGYMVASFIVERHHPLVDLARETVESYVLKGKVPNPIHMSPEMKEKAGVFVCLKKDGELRGCIGTFEPTRDNVAYEVIANAVSSATRDPRFLPVSDSELPELEYTVDVLTKPEPVESLEDLDPRRFGVIVESGRRRGLLLPDLEGVDTIEEQIAICRQKAGIPTDVPVKLYRFEVKRYK
ncbi:MAG: AmmeMemoRadiSam system protein A [Chloroflexi bacterium]|nr:AmmeMemoRadiSam system protein A [Chloroflexota bacterium]